MEVLLGQFVLGISSLVLTFVGVWVIITLIPFVKDKVKREYADRAVRFIEQVYTDIKGTEKYDEAFKWFVDQLAKYKIKVTEDEAKGLLESALYNMKEAYNKQW